MKKVIQKAQRAEKTAATPKIPENKNVLDSRKNEEFSFKGDDVTHNKKETKKKKH